MKPRWTLIIPLTCFVTLEAYGITIIRGTVWWLSFFIPGFALISW